MCTHGVLCDYDPRCTYCAAERDRTRLGNDND